MTSLDSIRDSLPDYARDLRLNLGCGADHHRRTGPDRAADLGGGLRRGHCLAARAVRRAISRRSPPRTWMPADLNAARAAAAIMGMNNIYYRFLHLVEDAEYQQLPARLRMNVLANPGIDKLDFELLSLAVSAINGCGTCVASHERQLRQHGVSREAIQSAVRIAATVHAVARALEQGAAREETAQERSVA